MILRDKVAATLLSACKIYRPIKNPAVSNILTITLTN